MPIRFNNVTIRKLNSLRQCTPLALATVQFNYCIVIASVWVTLRCWADRLGYIETTEIVSSRGNLTSHRWRPKPGTFGACRHPRRVDLSVCATTLQAINCEMHGTSATAQLKLAIDAVGALLRLETYLYIAGVSITKNETLIGTGRIYL